MGVEFIKEIHEQVYFERADTQHYMLLSLRSMAAVVPSRFLSLHPQIDQLLKLTRDKQFSGTRLGKETFKSHGVFVPAEAEPPEPRRS